MNDEPQDRRAAETPVDAPADAPSMANAPIRRTDAESHPTDVSEADVPSVFAAPSGREDIDVQDLQSREINWDAITGDPLEVDAEPVQEVNESAIDWQSLMTEPPVAQSLDLTGSDPGRSAAKLVAYAAALPASDLFLGSSESSVVVGVRHLGILKRLASVPRDPGRRVMNYIKALGGMDLAQRLRPQDGRWVLSLPGKRKIDLRINTVPTLHGEDMAIRLLDRDQRLMKLENLGLPAEDVAKLYGMLSSPSGLILVTGPTGAGKTTTLYACLSHLNDGTRKINTIEDPIEYALEGMNQSQVNWKIDLDFPELLRAVLRQSADVIMIGEVRDPTTAATAVRAAKSGLIVFATLHAATATAAVDAMLAMDVHPHFLATSLLGVIAQRLVRTLCPKCKQPIDISESPGTFEDVRPWLAPGQGQHIYSAPGCDACRFAGYGGRTGVFELFRVSREMRRLIADRQPVDEIRRQAVKEGMLDVRRSALLKVAAGITSTEEVMRVIPAEHLMPEGES